jgi:hypothetical protein
MCEAAKPPPGVAFSDVRFLDAEQVRNLREADGGLTKASEQDRASVLLYDAMWLRWGVNREAVDEQFYAKYVVSRDAQDLFWKSQRFRTVCSRTATETRSVYAHKLDDVLALDDYNLDLYKSRLRRYYDMLLYTQEAIDVVFGAAGMDALRSGVTIESPERIVSRDMNAHLDSLPAGRLLRLQKLFGLDRRQASKASGYSALQKMLKDSLDVTLERCSNSNKRARYHDLRLNANKHTDMETKYKPQYC